MHEVGPSSGHRRLDLVLAVEPRVADLDGLVDGQLDEERLDAELEHARRDVGAERVARGRALEA